MINKRVSLLFGLICFQTAFISHGQASGNSKLNRVVLPFSNTGRQSSVPEDWKDIQLMTIDKDQLFRDFRGNGKQLNMIIIATSGCGGTQAAIKYLKEVDVKYGNRVATYLLFSDNVSSADDVRKALFQYRYGKQCYIIDDSYGKNTLDDRKKGTDFRNSFCTECKSDVIGVPYDLVFDSNSNVLLHGYPNFKGPLQHVPSDYIGWLLEKEGKAAPVSGR